MSDDLWERHASWWQREFTDGVDPEYEEQILPLVDEWVCAGSRILDIGTGEGQIARRLMACGSDRLRASRGTTRGDVRSVIGVDPTTNQITEAHRRQGGPRYVQAEAGALPFGDSSFDVAVACLVFEHIDDVDTAISEVARVVEPGGRFVLFLNHPLIQTPDSGWIDDQVLDPPEQYWRIGEYLVETATVEQVEKGVFIRFVHRPLSRYLNALSDNGLLLEQIIEPPPPPGFLERAPGYLAAATIPRLMVLITRSHGKPRLALERE